jgi:pimeloyl-[acyl-carrier protein] methyl ester esterase
MSVHIETLGSGRNLVLLHGWGLHSGVWDGVREALAKRFCVHLVDLPGCGKSGECTPYTLEQLARLLADATPEPTTVCGWSLGAQVALGWGRCCARQVRRLVLVAATPRFVCAPGWPHGMESRMFAEFAAGVNRDSGGALKRFVSLQTIGAKDARSQSAWLRQRLFAHGTPGQAVLEAGLQILRGTDLRETVPALHQPVLLVHGAADTLVPAGAAHWLEQHLPDARLKIFAGCAHAPFLLRPEEFVHELTEFLDE